MEKSFGLEELLGNCPGCGHPVFRSDLDEGDWIICPQCLHLMDESEVLE